MSSNLADFIKSNIDESVTSPPAIIYRSNCLSFYELARYVVSISEFLRSTISSKLIIVEGDLSPDTLAVILACFLTGINFTIFVGLSEQEKSLRLRVLRSNFIDFAVVGTSDFAYLFQQSIDNSIKSIPVIPDSVSPSTLYLFSSGSTGIPKLISVDVSSFLSLYNFSSSATKKPRRYIQSLLIDHIGGLNTFLASYSSLSCLILPESDSFSSLIDAMHNHSVSILPSTPSILNILSQDCRFSSTYLTDLRLITYGTEKMPNSLLTYLKSVFPKTKFLQTFGTSETGILPTLPTGSSGKIRFRSSSDFKIVDSRLFVRKLYSSSYNNSLSSEASSDESIWFPTGDLAVLNSDSTVTILGRDKDVINVGGLKVSPNEIEDLALTHPQVTDCVAYPLPNPFTGHAVALRILVDPSCADPSNVISELKKFFLSSDKRKRPVVYKLVDFIEITSRGKKVRSFTN